MPTSGLLSAALGSAGLLRKSSSISGSRSSAVTVTLAMRGDASVSTALDSPHPRLTHAMAHSIVGSEPQQAERQEKSAVNATAERILEHVDCTERLKEARNGPRGFAGWSVDQWLGTWAASSLTRWQYAYEGKSIRGQKLARYQRAQSRWNLHVTARAVNQNNAARFSSDCSRLKKAGRWCSRCDRPGDRDTEQEGSSVQKLA